VQLLTGNVRISIVRDQDSVYPTRKMNVWIWIKQSFINCK